MDSKKLLIAIIVLAIIGIGVDALLTYNKLTDSSVGCQAGGGCDLAKGSIYSEFFGIPVSVFGLGAFLLFLVLAAGAWKGMITEKLAFKLIFAFGVLGLLAAVYFIYIMEFVLGAICPWCLASHAILLLLVIAAFLGWKGVKA